MLSFRNPHTRQIAIAALTAAGFLATFSLPIAYCQTGEQTIAPDQVPLKVQSNLVVVRTVVRDAKGQPVTGLKREDFKLFDRGKEQSIMEFEEVPAAAVSGPAGNVPKPSSEGLPGRFLALYFDNLDSTFADLSAAREAAERYLATGIQPQDRVAIITTEKMLSDFTSESKQIHDALTKLQPSARAQNQSHDCLALSDYQARQIVQYQRDYSIEAWLVALDEELQCPDHSSNPDVTHGKILGKAQNVVDKSESSARVNLDAIDRVVGYTSRMPGQRTVIVICPGFLTESEQPRLDSILNNALR
jgi:VWFA-related protein